VRVSASAIRQGSTRIAKRRKGDRMLRKLLIMASGSVLLLGVAQAQAPAGAADKGGPTDPQIAAIVVAANQADIDAAKVAKSHTKNKDVKAFADTMIRDHESVNKQAKALVKKLKVKPEPNATSKSLTKEGKDNMAALKKLKGADFDKAYVDAMVEDHQKAVDTFGKQADQNQSDIDHWAASTLPKLRDHLAHARELQQKESRADVSRNP
jgi:putative membrane protein